MKEQTQVMTSLAKYSKDELYRYSLKKTWDTSKPNALFIGINPSIATEIIMDKTVMNLMNHLIGKGYGQVEIVNLFAFRSQDQSRLKERKEQFEQVNREYVVNALPTADLIIVGWGRDADKNPRYKSTLDQIRIALIQHREKAKCFEDSKGNKNCHLSTTYNSQWKLVTY